MCAWIVISSCRLVAAVQFSKILKKRTLTHKLFRVVTYKANNQINLKYIE